MCARARTCVCMRTHACVWGMCVHACAHVCVHVCVCMSPGSMGLMKASCWSSTSPHHQPTPDGWRRICGPAGWRKLGWAAPRHPPRQWPASAPSAPLPAWPPVAPSSSRTSGTSSKPAKLALPLLKLHPFGQHSFSYCALRKWNSIPSDIHESHSDLLCLQNCV